MHLSVDCLSIHQNSVCFLLHNRNVLGSIPVAHSVNAKESYGEVKTVLSLLDYDQHRWVICVDLKMVIFFAWPTSRLYQISLLFLVLGHPGAT